MAVTIKPKRSSTTTNVPTLGDGEFAIQLADKRIFAANSTVVFDLFQNTVSNISISNATGIFSVGTSTVNSVINSLALTLANSTVTWSLIKPTAAQVAAATYYPASDGTWKIPAGGSATPGGSNTYIQFNDSGSFGGNVNLTYDKSSNTLGLSGNLVANADYLSIGNTTSNLQINSSSLTFGGTLPDSMYMAANSYINLDSGSWITMVAAGANNITAPTPANSLSYFAKMKANRVIPITLGFSGWDTPLQAHFMHNQVYQMVAAGGSGAAGASQGVRMVTGNTVAFTANVQTSANLYMSQPRIRQTTGATANAVVSWRGTTQEFWRGNGAGLGGFYAVCRFGVGGHTTNGRAFAGFMTQTANVANGTVANTVNVIGFGFESGVSNLCFFSGNSTACNTINLNLSRTVVQTNWWECIIFAPPNGANITYQVTNLTDGTVVSGTANMACVPATTQFLNWQFWASNGADAAAQQMDWGGVQIEVNL